MNWRKVAPWAFGLAAASLFAAGLMLNGPFDPELSPGALSTLMLVFASAALVLAAAAIRYFGTSIKRTLHGLAWAPLVLAALGLVSSALILRALEFNVHLYGVWVMLFALTLTVSGLGVVALGSSALWGVLVRRLHKVPKRGETG